LLCFRLGLRSLRLHLLAAEIHQLALVRLLPDVRDQLLPGLKDRGVVEGRHQISSFRQSKPPVPPPAPPAMALIASSMVGPTFCQFWAAMPPRTSCDCAIAPAPRSRAAPCCATALAPNAPTVPAAPVPVSIRPPYPASCRSIRRASVSSPSS